MKPPTSKLIPLSQTQLGIYLDSLNAEGEQTYHVPFLLKMCEGVAELLTQEYTKA